MFQVHQVCMQGWLQDSELWGGAQDLGGEGCPAHDHEILRESSECCRRFGLYIYDNKNTFIART